MAGQQLCLCGGAPTGIRTNGDWSRAHGWTLPLHPLQGVAFLFLAMFALLHFGVLVPSLPHESPWKMAANIVIGIVFLVHILVLLTCMSLNPGDPNVRMSAGGAQGSKTFDRSQRPHVILDQYCCICQVKVGVKSKHCSACNKCISDFDHHCKWLNNCIGGRNYKLFLVCVTSALAGCLFIFVTSVSLITAYFFQNSWLNQPLSLRVYENSTRLASFDPPMNLTGNATHPSLVHHREGHHFWVFLPVTGSLWLMTVVTTALLSLAACALLTHLLAFHAYLISQNLSTYEYIVQKREANSGAGQPRNFGNHSGRGTGGQLVKRGLLCPLKKWRRFKMANQILPVSNKNNEGQTRDVEAAVTANPDKNNRLANSAESRSTSRNGEETDLDGSQVSVPSADTQTLEQRTGNIYLGSPVHRARRLLPPINHPDSARAAANVASNLGDTFTRKVIQDESVEQEMKKTESESQMELSPSDEQSCSEIATSSLPSLPDTERLEIDLPPPAGQLCSRHLSISTQSLNSVSREEPILDDSSSTSRLLDTKMNLSGSLSNLLILDNVNSKENEEELEEYEMDDHLSVEDVVQEVNIVQSPFRQTKQEQLLFCPGKRRSESVTGIAGSELSSHRDDLSVSDMCSLDPNYADEMLCERPLSRKRPSVDVLLVPLGIDAARNAFDVTEPSRNEGTFIILRTDCDAKTHRFESQNTNFISDSAHRLRRQLIV